MKAVNKQKLLKGIILLYGILICMPLCVDARTTTNGEICVNTGNGNHFNFYKIKEMGKNVIPFNIIYNDIVGTEKYPKECFCSTVGDACLKKQSQILATSNADVVENNCADDYKFTVESQGTACKISDKGTDKYEFQLCPIGESSKVVSNINDQMKYNYIEKDNIFKVTFFSDSNPYKGKVSVESIGKIEKCSLDSNNENNCSYIFDVDTNTGYAASDASITKYSANDVKNGIYLKPGTDFYFIFYLEDSNDSCNGVRLGYIESTIPSTVPNPMHGSKICTDFRTSYPSGTIESIMVSDCYAEEILSSELATIEENIKSQIAEVEAIHSEMQETNAGSINNFTCLFENNSTEINKKVNIYTKTDYLEETKDYKYWRAQCTETMSIEYDDPKAVKAGKGFNYTAKIIINRTCKPVRVSQPKYLPECEYGVECWGGPVNHQGEAGAGPNEDFDNCIDTCDGGTYTQNCINSCYSKIYEKSVSYSSDNVKLTGSTFLTASRKNYDVVRLAVTNWGNKSLIGTKNGTRLPISSGCIISGNNIDNGCGTYCEGGTKCTTEHGKTFTYLNVCNANGDSAGTKCYEVYKNWPCAETGNRNNSAAKKYKNEINKSIEQYKSVINIIKNFNSDKIANEKYEIEIKENYNLQANGKYEEKTTVFSNKDGNRIDVKVQEITGDKATEESYKTVSVAKKVSGVTDGMNLDIETFKYTISREVEVGIGAAYVSKVNGNDVIYNDKTTLTNHDLDNNKMYFSAQNKYFTRLDTKLVNNYLAWPYFKNNEYSDSTVLYNKNIHVRFYKIGSWNQWGVEDSKGEDDPITISCFYGVAPGIVCKDGDTNCPEAEGGLRYIFRPINLSDMFPNNRNPRFNWTGTIDKSTNTSTGAALTTEKSLYSDAIDPTSLIENIESKNESIYDVTSDSSEVDYEFVLTKENIRNIRDYNKNVNDYNGDGERNYLDYNMSCYTNARGQEICTSRFLDNIDGNKETEANSNFITYSVNGYGIDARKSIAGCNNAINGTECYTISK